MHHTARSGAGLVLLTAREWVTVVRHHPREGSKSHNAVAPQSPGSTGCFILSYPEPLCTYPRRHRNHQAPSRRPPRQPCWWWVSQDSRFCGERMGVMCPKEWMETRSEATASGEGRKCCQKSGLGPPLWWQLLPLNTPAVEKAQEPAQLPWSSGSWIRLGHFLEASKAVGSTSPRPSTVCKTMAIPLAFYHGPAVPRAHSLEAQ